jgi:prepilin-type N-terminal cleavage/methylation domain-containing protein
MSTVRTRPSQVHGVVQLVQRARRRIGYAADGGFSLLEVLVSITLFVIIATVTATAIGNDLIAARTAKQRTQASNVAQSLLAGLERTKTLPATFPTSAPGGWTVRVAVNPSTGCTTGSTRTVSVLVWAAGNFHGAPAARTDSVIAC